jgi:hypothetical protein
MPDAGKPPQGGARKASERGRPFDGNDRETGARAPKPDPVHRQPDPVDTGDRGDRPKKPYGLTEPMDDRGAKTRHHDGKRE